MDTFKKIEQQKKYLEDLGYKVLYLGLFGSQNYGLDDEESDIDLRAIVLPTLEQLIKREKISKQITNELGMIDIKDPVTFYEVISKGNFTYIEAIQTKYFLGDENIRKMFKNIKLNVHSLKGDMYGKAKAFVSPYSTKDKHNGYVAKEMYQLLRLSYLLREKNTDISFIDYNIYPRMRDFLLEIKHNKNNIIEDLDMFSTSFEDLKEWIEEVCDGIVPKKWEFNYEYPTLDLLDIVISYTKRKLLESISIEEAK